MKQLIFKTLFLFLILPVFIYGQPEKNRVITTGTLFEEMINMHNLAYFPNPGYKTIQYSSFDHRSTLPGGPYWFANSDGFGGEPVPNFEKVLKKPDEEGTGEYLIADVKGPGAIVRLWTASISGEIKLFIDNASRPVYEGNANDFFHNVYDKFKEMDEETKERFEGTIYQRDACYAPVPFAKNMRIVWTGSLKKIHFYQVQVRLYEKGAKVKSFSPEDISRYKDTIDRVTLALKDPDKHIKYTGTEKSFEHTIKADETEDVLLLTGEQTVEKLTLKITAGDMDKALRQTVLHIICDDFPWGQVQSPVGDFFGAAPGINPYMSLPFTVQEDGTMICRYVMPFKKNLKIKFENMGDQDVTVTGSVNTAPFKWTDETLHFYARWRVNHNMIASNKNVQDLPFVLAKGKGVYVGTTSYLLNPNEVPTPYGNWWGEGDEKIFVDDDKVPSTFGTGSEDYYNYSWSSPDIFYFPYCGQPRNDGPGNRGFVTNFRWQILDPIPFKESFRFYMELYSHERTPGLSYARIGYHYGQPGITDDHEAIMPEDVRFLKLPENWTPAARMGARNSVIYKAEDIVTDIHSTHFKEGRLWAGGKLLVWKPEKQGDNKDFAFGITSPGKKRIRFILALTPESGKISFKLDGESINLNNKKEVLNLHRQYRTLLRNFTLETRELTAGKHILSFIYEGTDAQSNTGEIGIDFIWIQDVK